MQAPVRLYPTDNVPNLPCGVERRDRFWDAFFLFNWFLIYRVELKEMLLMPFCNQFGVPNLPCGVESTSYASSREEC